MPQSIRLPTVGEEIWHGERAYRLGELIGEGYFGKVYACTDVWLNELVAKVLVPRGLTYDQVRTQWMTELGNLIALRHPCVTYVHDAFEYERTFYLVVERCSTDLTSLFSIQGYDGNAWLPTLARDVLQGVQYIHDSGYVHKDLHPGNIFVSATRDRLDRTKAPVLSFKIGDLGITRLEGDINVFNTIMARWMLPPEAVHPAQFGDVGRAVDIYHTGLVFLSVLLGYVPSFTQDEVLGGAPRQLAEQVQSPYAAPVAKALRRHSAHRPQSAIEFWQEIVAVMPHGAMPA